MARGATMANPAAAPDGGAPRPRVVAIVPALDEEVAIARLLPEFPRAVVADVIVVDNGSRDATAAVARRAGARGVLEPRRGHRGAPPAGPRAAPGADRAGFPGGGYNDQPPPIHNRKGAGR